MRHTEGVPIACSSVIEAAGAVCQSLSLKAICADPGSAGIDEIAAGAEAGICMGELYCAASSAYAHEGSADRSPPLRDRPLLDPKAPASAEEYDRGIAATGHFG